MRGEAGGGESLPGFGPESRSEKKQKLSEEERRGPERTRSVVEEESLGRIGETLRRRDKGRDKGRNQLERIKMMGNGSDNDDLAQQKG